MVFPGGPPRGISTAKLATGDGGALTVNLTALPIAWRNGPALQVTLAEMHHSAATSGENHPANPTPQAKADIIEFRDIGSSRPKAEIASDAPDLPSAEIIVEAAREEQRATPRIPDFAPQPPKAEATPSRALPELSRSGGIAEDEELRNILDTAADGIITLDGAGNIRTFSAGAEAIFGYRIAEVVEKPLATLLTLGQPQDLARLSVRPSGTWPCDGVQ